jgi:hypothetical protein
MTLLSPLQAAVAELSADAGVIAIVGVDQYGVRRIRPVEPLGTVGTTQGDARGPGGYIPFVVVSVLDSPARTQMPIRDGVLGITAYDATDAKAEILWLACEGVFLNRAARAASSGLGIWFSRPRSIGPDRDPDTKQPCWRGILTYPTTIGAVTP